MKTNKGLVIWTLHALFLLITSTVIAQSVDPMSGRAIVNLPLASVSALDMSASVSVAYNGGALQVSEGPGTAGMGWNVVMGGSIRREVRGLPDDINTPSRFGWLNNGAGQTIQNFTPTANDDLLNCANEAFDWGFMHNTLGYIQDTEPDIYYFQAPGISGKFIYGPDQAIKLIPYQDLQITFVSGTYYIKTNSGVTYTFNNVETTTRQAVPYTLNPVKHFLRDYNYYTTPLTYNSAWQLSSIQSGTTGTTVNMTYQNAEEAQSSKFLTVIKPSDTTKVDTIYYLKDQINSLLLKQISLKNYTINIAWTNSLVDKVTITESESGETKEFDLTYKSVRSDIGFPDITMPFLTQIKQQFSCVAYPSYVFAYSGVDTTYLTAYVTWRTGYGADFFGYNNGQGKDSYPLHSNKNIPKVYFYPSESGARRYRITQIPGGTPTILPDKKYQDRDVSPQTVGFGALTAIAYPTGGTTNIVYEPNKYYDSSTGEELFGPGVRVSSLSTSSGVSNTLPMTKNYEYKTSGASPRTSGVILYPAVFAYAVENTTFRSQSDLGPGPQVMYARVKESIPGQGYRVYLFDIPNTYPDLTSSSSPSKIARHTCVVNNPGLMKTGYYQFPFAPITDYDFKRGFLTRLSEYSESGLLTQEKRMSYSLPQASSTIKGLRFEAMTDAAGDPIYYYSQYQIPINQSRILAVDTVIQIGDVAQTDVSRVITSYQYNTKNMLTQTTQSNDDNSSVTQNTRYALDFPVVNPNSTDIQAKAISKLNSINRYGEVIEAYQSITPIGGVSEIIGASLTIFKDSGNFVLPYKQFQFPQGQPFTPATLTGANTQFSYDSKYIMSGISEFRGGLLVNQLSASKALTSTHYATGLGQPIASFVNAKAENTVYDGFEFQSVRGLTSTGTTPTTAIGWTGAKALVVNSGTTLTSDVTVRAGNAYRISCWLYATAATDLTVQAMSGTTVQASVVIKMKAPGNLNKWTYKDTTISVSGVAANFKWNLINNATVANPLIIDDFVALPKTARISSRTFLPLTGPTSQSDDRGNSATTTYDTFGRPVNTFDRARNLVQVQEYAVQRHGAVVLSGNFTSNVTQYVAGQTIVFTATNPACIPGVNYRWLITSATGQKDSVVTSQSSINYQFNQYGSYSVELKATKTGYQTAVFADMFCVSPASFSITLSHSGSSNFVQCSPTDDGRRVFTAIAPNLAKLNWNLSYAWEFTDASGNFVIPLVGMPEFVSISPDGTQITMQSPLRDYQVRCTVKANVTASTFNNFNCILQQPITSAVDGIHFVPNPQCQ